MDPWLFSFAKCTFVTNQVSAFCTVLLSLPSRGAWIEIWWPATPADGGLGSLPSRGAWIEISQHSQTSPGSMSLPSRGAWIEIVSFLVSFSVQLSLPSRGAWIEILTAEAVKTLEGLSLPSRGAWIEIAETAADDQPSHCRSPHGERGLKSERPGHPLAGDGRSPHGERGLKYHGRNRSLDPAGVAPLTGSVD